jgi:hypothetical protein
MTGPVRVDLWGDHLRFWCSRGKLSHRGYEFELLFDGHVNDDTIYGKLVMSEHGRRKEYAWTAEREKADYTGTWEWPCATGSHSVRLRVTQRNGRFYATYLDQDRTLPVTDFYDFGGGFYFTLLIGQEKRHGLGIFEDTGWLIGASIIDNGTLKGTTEFYPTQNDPQILGQKKASRGVIKDWAPCLIQPELPGKR